MTTESPILGKHRAATIAPLENGDHLDQPTFHERYESMPTSFRAELIEGVVYVASPLKDKHGQFHVDLSTWLNLYRLRVPGAFATDNATVILDGQSEVQPDLSLYLVPGNTRETPDGYIAGPPELVIEVALSSVSIDLFAKRRDYERCGVDEYLVLIIKEQKAVWLGRAAAGAAFSQLPPDPDGVLRSRRFPGLWLDPAALFARDTQRLLDVLNLGLASAEHAAFAAARQAR